MARRIGSLKKKVAKPPKTGRPSTAPTSKQTLSKPKPGAAKKSVYLHITPLAIMVDQSKPKTGSVGGPLVELTAIKSAAIDALLSSIEDCERRMSAVRRASSLGELRNLLAAKL